MCRIHNTSLLASSTGGSEPIPTALSEKVRDFLHKGGGVIPKIPIPKWLFFSFLGYKMIIGH